jgi:uracil-DNA glycosylase
MSKESNLAAVAEDIAKLKKYFDLADKSVPGEGNPDSELMIIGEAPGHLENRMGRPFVGRAGKLLEKLLTEIGIERKDVFITSIVKFYPGQRAPSQKEIDLCLPYTLKQIDIIRPKVMLLLGSIAIKALLGKSKSITKEHGKLVNNELGSFFPTFHPAAALRFEKYLPEIRSDLKKLYTILHLIDRQTKNKNQFPK